MDANRSLIVFAAAILVLIVAFLGLIPALIKGVNPDAAGQSPMVFDEGSELFMDDAETFAGPPKPPPVRRAKLLGPSEDFVPRTRAERAWHHAWEKLDQEEAEAARDREDFEAWRGFMESPLGKNVQGAFELLRRGHSDEAAKILEEKIPEFEDLPFMVKQPLLKASVRLFKASGNLAAMGRVLVQFLENQERYLDEAHLEGRDRDAHQEMLDEVRELLREARARAAAVGS